jgi:RNA polymerase sigma factor (TIGR02999 family)
VSREKVSPNTLQGAKSPRVSSQKRGFDPVNGYRCRSKKVQQQLLEYRGQLIDYSDGAMRADVTHILNAVDRGDPKAAAELLPLVYDELRKLAASRMANEGEGHTLQPTALVHEAYMRLLGPDGRDPGWSNRGHFFAAAAEAMRRILIDCARAKRSAKRGGRRARVGLDPAQITVDSVPDDLLDLDEAIDRLKKEHPAKAELVKLRFYTGLSTDEAARILGIAPRTARDHWAYARTWLFREMNRGS